MLLSLGDTPVLTGQLLTMGILMLVQLVLNIAGINLVAVLNQVSVWWHIAIVGLVVVLVFALGKPDVSGLTLFAIQPQDVAGSWSNDIGPLSLKYGPAISYPIVLAFFFSLLQANWTYTGYDASAHVAEETVGARMSSAWGVFLSVAVSAIVGFVFLLALTTHLPDLKTLFPAELNDATLPASSQYYFGGGVAVIASSSTTSTPSCSSGSGWATCSRAGIAIAMAFCGLSSVAAAGRMLFAFARDDGVPASGWLKKVSHRYRTPANALIGHRRRRLGVHRSGRHRRRRHRDRHRDRDQHHLPVRGLRGRHLPRNDDAGVAEPPGVEPWPLVEAGRLAGHLLGHRADDPVQLADVGQHLVAVHGRHVHRVPGASTTSAGRGPGSPGPQVMGAEAELTELEREFEQAAEHLGGTTTA